MKILFFGSSTDSVIVLEKIYSFGVVCVITQPPKPNPTPVQTWADDHKIPVLSFRTNPQKPWQYVNEQQVIDTLQPFQPDLIITASYGVKIPSAVLHDAKYGGINVHPSLLPRWRGGDPVPWAILSGDHQIGVTIETIADAFDSGVILAQKKIPILPTDTSKPLRTKLFILGADLLITLLPKFMNNYPPKEKKHTNEKQPYARRLNREDGFEPWPFAESDTARIERKFRAFHPWPGLWTIINNKRVKILEFNHGPTIIQLEGKNPVSWEQFQKAYLSP